MNQEKTKWDVYKKAHVDEEKKACMCLCVCLWEERKRKRESRIIN